MRTLFHKSLFFRTVLAALAAIGLQSAFALDNQKADAVAISHVINPSGASLLGNDVITAIGQNGHYRSSVDTVPPLITASSPDKVLSNSAGGLPTEIITVALEISKQVTAHDWSDSGKNAGAIPVAANIVNPSGYHAFDGA